MARIIIADLHPIDSEAFLNELTNQNSQTVFGGQDDYRPQILDFGVKAFEFVLVIAAIDAISFLTNSFINKDST
ncbi:hypothetical protein H6G54_21535 [Anabaena cylindrica FACHB-243]|uniref:Uncharacterized protein n=1 Tax=Anabaena cylindrica (strain ATCC 27899 / PCC 7122) TaxID=272123 RepID=K9ZAK5_ANACC|nr:MULTISPECIES: hypothetical protein [Anabaena]AFZ55759.1 hypothetical protein Anacy_0151 [Anabaena cylindrica PCC 7122]MBD2420240.1 hypothetical protein [Anabaena cylindrica FACHB-243]MCM2406108.1 hypothetical protein [Anabaena sp. CCAP 1446/1C]BAY01821.1 hypothetical protein NIES19_10570 [Anabaena cylindrica PCC 7122]